MADSMTPVGATSQWIAAAWSATVVMPGDPETKYKSLGNYPVIPRSIPNMPRMFFVTGSNDPDALAAGGPGLDVILKRFDAPDEVREMTKGKFEIVRLGGLTIGRATYEPGWKWSEHVGAARGQSRCTVEHVGMVSWGIGNEPYVSIQFLGADH